MKHKYKWYSCTSIDQSLYPERQRDWEKKREYTDMTKCYQLFHLGGRYKDFHCTILSTFLYIGNLPPSQLGKREKIKFLHFYFSWSSIQYSWICISSSRIQLFSEYFFWIFIERIATEAEAPILWPPDAKSWLIGKDPDAGKDWRQEKGTTEDEMVGWHHWLNGHEFEQAPGDGEGQGGLACCSPWGHKELDMTEQLNWYWFFQLLCMLETHPTSIGKKGKNKVSPFLF